MLSRVSGHCSRSAPHRLKYKSGVTSRREMKVRLRCNYRRCRCVRYMGRMVKERRPTIGHASSCRTKRAHHRFKREDGTTTRNSQNSPTFTAAAPVVLMLAAAATLGRLQRMRSRVGHSKRASQSQWVWFIIAARDGAGATPNACVGVQVSHQRRRWSRGLQVSNHEGILPNIASKPGICALCHLSHGPLRCIQVHRCT